MCRGIIKPVKVPIKPQDGNDLQKEIPTRVGIIRGGSGPEYEMSLKTGSEILSVLRSKGNQDYKTVDILIDKNNVWHVGGKEINPRYIKDYVDLVWIATHGENGSNGEIQALLEEFSIPYLGSDPVSSELTYHRGRTKDRLKNLGLMTPKHYELRNVYTGDIINEEERRHYIEKRAMEAFRSMPGPWIVKPLGGGSSMYTYLAKSYSDLVTAISVVSRDVNDLLIEEYVQGREVVSGVVEGLRNRNKYVIPAHEITHDNDIFSHRKRVEGDFNFFPLHRSSQKLKEIVHNLTETLHDEFGMQDYFSANFIVTPKGVYVTNIDSLPPLHEHSLVFKGLDTVGVSPEEFITHQLKRLIDKRKGREE